MAAEESGRPLAGIVGRPGAVVVLVLAASILWLCAAGGSSARSAGANAAGRTVAYPLKASRNGRYLVDQRNVPFMIVGDSPQSLIGNLSLGDAAAYIAQRRSAGFNALWVNLLCVRYTGCRADGTTFDGIAPFTTPGDLATPNPQYFERADAMIRLAANAGIAVFLDPIETGGWLGVLRHNGVAKAHAYGRWVGQRYRRFANIVWLNGNDFQSWRNQADDAVVRAVAEGIRSVDPAHLQTVELDYPRSTSRDDPLWQPIIGLDSAYSFYATYAEVLRAYNRTPPMPTYMIEANYEHEQYGPGVHSIATLPVLRRQEYWSMLSGATGQFYGSAVIWPFIDGWKEYLEIPSVTQIGYLAKLFASIRWFQLVPDQTHRVVTAGYGTSAPDAKVKSSTYVTTAATRDGRLAVSYLPAGGTITVDMGRFARRVKARWYDPTN